MNVPYYTGERIGREIGGVVKPGTLTSRRSRYIAGLQARILLHNSNELLYNACYRRNESWNHSHKKNFSLATVYCLLFKPFVLITELEMACHVTMRVHHLH